MTESVTATWLTADEFITLTNVLGPRRVALIVDAHNQARRVPVLIKALASQCPHHLTASSSKPDEQGRLHHFAIDNEYGYAHWLPCTLTVEARTALIDAEVTT